MSEEIQSATPAEQVAAEQVQQDASNSAESSTEQTQEQQQEQTTETQEEKAKKEPWFQKRIGELTREKYEARRAAEEATRQAEQMRQYLAQVQQGEQAQQPNEQVDVMTLAEQKAAQLLAERSFNEACNKVYSEGAKEFQDFDAANRNLQMLGAGKEFYELATTTDAGHKLIHHLGSNLEEADRILRLPPVQMARELTRLEIKLSQPPAPKPVSKAPAPIKPIGSSATGEVDPAKVSDAEWYERVYLKNRK